MVSWPRPVRSTNVGIAKVPTGSATKTRLALSFGLVAGWNPVRIFAAAALLAATARGCGGGDETATDGSAAGADARVESAASPGDAAVADGSNRRLRVDGPIAWAW